MNAWEKQLDPQCSKSEALELIQQDLERGYYPSAHAKARECLERGFLLSAKEKMHLSVAIHAGGQAEDQNLFARHAHARRLGPAPKV